MKAFIDFDFWISDSTSWIFTFKGLDLLLDFKRIMIHFVQRWDPLTVSHDPKSEFCLIVQHAGVFFGEKFSVMATPKCYTVVFYPPYFVKPFHDSFIILECLSTCPVCILQHGTYILCLLELISAFDFTTHFFKFHEQAKKMNGRVCTKKSTIVCV